MDVIYIWIKLLDLPLKYYWELKDSQLELSLILTILSLFGMNYVPLMFRQDKSLS